MDRLPDLEDELRSFDPQTDEATSDLKDRLWAAMSTYNAHFAAKEAAGGDR